MFSIINYFKLISKLEHFRISNTGRWMTSKAKYKYKQ